MPARPLTETETAILRPVFGGSLDYAAVRVTFDGPLSAGSTKVLGRTIHFRTAEYEPAILVHEAVHVWQWRHGGAAYAVQSLRDQFAAWLRTGSRGGAYPWRPAARAGVPWARLRSEPQAKLIEDAFRAGLTASPTALLPEPDSDLTAYARAALAELVAGRGAPRGW
jgi:hypothetical protein